MKRYGKAAECGAIEGERQTVGEGEPHWETLARFWRRRANMYRDALERAGDMGAEGYAEAGCPVCLLLDDYSREMMFAKVHLPSCFIGQALAFEDEHATLAPGPAQPKEKP